MASEPIMTENPASPPAETADDPNVGLLASAIRPATVGDPFNYRLLPPEHRQLARKATQDIRKRYARAVGIMIEIGCQLLAMKQQLGHGFFTTWVEGALPFGIDTAQAAMRVASVFGGTKAATSQFLSWSVAKELAGAKVPAELRGKFLDRIADGEKVTVRQVRDALTTPGEPDYDYDYDDEPRDEPGSMLWDEPEAEPKIEPLPDTRLETEENSLYGDFLSLSEEEQELLLRYFAISEEVRNSTNEVQEIISKLEKLEGVNKLLFLGRLEYHKETIPQPKEINEKSVFDINNVVDFNHVRSDDRDT